jgi:hypothetical protein
LPRLILQEHSPGTGQAKLDFAITDKGILKQLSECGEWAGHLAGAALGVAILHADPGEKFQIMFDIDKATSHGSSFD